MIPPSTYWNSLRHSPSIVNAINSIKFDILCDIASSLTGRRCTINTQTYTYGGVNLLFELSLGDGEFWIARIRRPDVRYPLDGMDYVLESEVATMRFVHASTSIPVPAVRAHNAHFGNQNPVGMPYIIMDAMPGKRLYGSPRSDFIPDAFKEKVYRQFADFLLQLYDKPFTHIGMLFANNSTPSGVQVGEIHDHFYRFHPYGPFATSQVFYQARWALLDEYYATQDPPPPASDIVPDDDMSVALQCLVDQRTANGPFYLTHPDYQIHNFLFDDQFTITGVLDWSGCQTLPLESFAKHPGKIIPDADQFLSGMWGELATPELRSQWAVRRAFFLRVVKECMRSRNLDRDDLLYELMLSSHAFFACILDDSAILATRRWLHRTEFEKFVANQVPNAMEDADVKRYRELCQSRSRSL